MLGQLLDLECLKLSLLQINLILIRGQDRLSKINGTTELQVLEEQQSIFFQWISLIKTTTITISLSSYLYSVHQEKAA